MNPLLIRFAKRRTSWEEPTVSKVRDCEFKDRDGVLDLRPSVYELQAESFIPRAYAEHFAAARLNDPKSTIGVDTDGAGAFQVVPGSPEFAFIRDQHREVVLNSAEELDRFIGTLLSDLQARRRPVEKKAVMDYVKARLGAADDEWRRMAADARAADWLRKLAIPNGGGRTPPPARPELKAGQLSVAPAAEAPKAAQAPVAAPADPGQEAPSQSPSCGWCAKLRAFFGLESDPGAKPDGNAGDES